MSQESEKASAICVDDRAFEYLAIQRGKIADLSGDRTKWHPAYEQSLQADLKSMLPWLPPAADRVMDIGSGLGGIDILLARHFHQPEIWLLDGDDDSPVVVRHAETFNCMTTARRFLSQNHVVNVVTVSPGMEAQAPPCDLIISLASWCFHYGPHTYLEWAKACSKPGTILILDVRKQYIWWRKDLAAAFQEIGVAISGEKFDRVVYKAR